MTKKQFIEKIESRRGAGWIKANDMKVIKCTCTHPTCQGFVLEAGE